MVAIYNALSESKVLEFAPITRSNTLGRSSIGEST